MAESRLIVIASWLDALGQIVAAVGATQQVYEESSFNHNVISSGETLQSVGKAIIAVEETDPVKETGDWIEGAGAGTSAFSAYLQVDEEYVEAILLEVYGDSMQAVGPALSSLVEENNLIVYGNYLKTIGASLEALGAMKRIQGSVDKGRELTSIGSWIQASGGTLIAIVVTDQFYEIDNDVN